MRENTEWENHKHNETIREQQEHFTIRENETFIESTRNQTDSPFDNVTFIEKEDNLTNREDNNTLIEDQEKQSYNNDSTFREDSSTVVEDSNNHARRFIFRHSINLPVEVERNYEIERELECPSGEADVFIIRHRESGQKYFFKLYHKGIQPDGSVLRLIQNECSRDDVVEIIDFSTDNRRGRAWEIHEYCPLGSISWGEWANTNKFPYGDEFISNFFKEVSKAIHNIHQIKGTVAHRDIKPSNILIRSVEPLDLVLTDFGIARDRQDVTARTKHFAGTKAYTAPEVYNYEITAKSDWFALGAIVFELFTNRKLLGDKRNPNPTEIQAQTNCDRRLYYKNINENTIVDERWRNLIKGLVTYEKDHRWGYKEIQKWLNGENPAIYWIEAKGGVAGFSPEDCLSVPWEEDLIDSPLVLARSFGQNWDEAKKALKGRVAVDIKDFLSNFQDAAPAIELLNSNKSPEMKLLEFQLMIDREESPIYSSYRIEESVLEEQITKAYYGDEDAKQWLYGLVKCDGLILYGSYKDDKKTGRVGKQLKSWYLQSEDVKKLVPRDKQKIVDNAFRDALPQLFAKAYKK